MGKAWLPSHTVLELGMALSPVQYVFLIQVSEDSGCHTNVPQPPQENGLSGLSASVIIGEFLF